MDLHGLTSSTPVSPQDSAVGAPGASSLKYADSIESLVRNNIQKTKIDMANEVIDAGRFNMATTQEERKETLEALLQVRAHCLLFAAGHSDWPEHPTGLRLDMHSSLLLACA